MTALLFIVVIISLSACIFAVPHLAVYWAIALALCPILLLLFWKKPTLPSSQNIYSVVFALSFGTLLVFFGSNLYAGLPFYSVSPIAYFGIFVGTLAFLTLCFSAILVKFTKRHYRLFAIGVLFSIAYCCIPQNSLALCAVAFGLLVVATTCILSSACVMRKRLKVAAKTLEKRDVALPLLTRNMAVVATVINLFFVIIVRFCSPSTVKIANLSANIVCAVLDFVLLFTYLRQPLDDVCEYQIKLLQQDNADVDKELVREHLQDSLCNKQIYPFAMMLKKVLNIFFRTRIVGLEKVTETSAVFVANHYEIFGPFITALKFPLSFRPWTDGLMTDKRTLTRQLRSGVEVATRKWLIKPIRKKLPALIASTLWKTLQFARALSVYRNNPEKISAMMNETVETLKMGDQILVFPEKPPVGEYYKDGGIDKFQTGFVEIGEAYKCETNKDLCFYPLYIDKKGHQMIVGDKITFDSTAPLHDEKVRVSNYLYEKMSTMSEKCQKKT